MGRVPEESCSRAIAIGDWGSWLENEVAPGELLGQSGESLLARPAIICGYYR